METQHGIVVHTHRLEPGAGVYVPTGSFDQLIKLDEPWPMELSIHDITPRFYRPADENR